MFATILAVLIPYFLLVALGGLLRNRLSENAWLGLDRLNFDILFPALLFSAAASRPIAPSNILNVGLSVWILIFFSLGLAWLFRNWGPERFVNFAAQWQCSWRFNSAVGFVAISAINQDAASAFMPIVIGLAVPMANICAVSALSRGQSMGIVKTIKAILLNPFFLGSFLGVIVGLTALEIPRPILLPIEVLARAAIPLALLSIGATMDWGALAKLDRFLGVLNFIKLIAMPIAAALGAHIVGFGPELSAALIVFAALPTASAAHVLAAGFGAERRPTATLIAQSTLLSALTLPLWVYYAGTLFP